ncbi:uncharacterized protein LOC126834947 [Adelges cooleyi]|uniref:uncharacterized protein LOC126834947 n=1 Tax=Adelges cooleyi TaxID=133065 RepID=UPI00217F2D8A|nr:uncharacterized protein LOC126834947 [Adelges cooleyi]
MAFKGLKSMLSVFALATYTLAAPSTTLPALTKTSPTETEVPMELVKETLLELSSALSAGSTKNGRKEMHYDNYQGSKYSTISSLIHLLATVGSAIAPLIGAIVGPLMSNIANGITWAITHTISSGFSLHGLFTPALGPGHGHGSGHGNPHPISSYSAAEAQSEATVETYKVPVATAEVDQTPTAAVETTAENGSEGVQKI